jgi:hypothetical protein
MTIETITPKTGIDLLKIPSGKEVRALRKALLPGLATFSDKKSIDEIAAALVSVGVAKESDEARTLVPQLEGNKYVFKTVTMADGPFNLYLGFTKIDDNNYTVERNRASQ